MDQISAFLGWLFGTRGGVLALVLGAVVFFAILALVLERRTRVMYRNHERSDGDWSLFDDED